MCFFNLSRAYLFIRVLRDWLVSDLPKRHTVTGLAQVKNAPIRVSNRTPMAFRDVFSLSLKKRYDVCSIQTMVVS